MDNAPQKNPVATFSTHVISDLMGRPPLSPAVLPYTLPIKRMPAGYRFDITV